MHPRFNRYEIYAQDTWKLRGNLTIDYGIRYSLYPPVTNANNVLTNFLPSAYHPANAPKGLSWPDGTHRSGNAVYAFDKTNVQPRVGYPGAGQQTGLFWFDPNAYLPLGDGTFGNSGGEEVRQPGRNQTDLSISKNWIFNGTQRIQFRANIINAFNARLA